MPLLSLILSVIFDKMATINIMEEHAEADWVLLSLRHKDATLTAKPSQRRELEWLLNELRETLEALKSGLQDCYALLAPVEPGSTLVVSTPRAEIVKGPCHARRHQDC